MKMEVLADVEQVAVRAAALIAASARAAFKARKRFVMAVSGGHAPWMILRMLGKEEVPWGGVHILQVDERIEPAGDPDRDLIHLRESLLANTMIETTHVHPMPVDLQSADKAIAAYTRTLVSIAGPCPVIDLVHLGLGSDGHTASLVPGDPILQVMDRDVAITGVYQGRRRMSLTYPVLNRAAQILWVVTGSENGEALAQLLNGSTSIPGGRIRRDNALILADQAAAEKSAAMSAASRFVS